MKQTLRTVLFWMHLSAGAVAGLIILVMGATGAALSFQPQLLDWAESGSRRVTPPAPDAARMSTEKILERVRGSSPAAAATAVTIYADREAAVRVSTGRETGVHVDPYTGEVRPLAGEGWRRFFALMIEWHRYLGTSGDNRNLGRAITGVCNAAFLFLALSGLYLWWPRRWNLRAMRSSLWFRRGLTGRPRDFNWHNVIGFWSLPVLIVVTSSGMMISYRWVSNLIYALAGESAPASAGPGGGPAVKIPEPPPGTEPLALDALLAAVTREVPDWKSATIRLGRGGRAQALALSVKQAGGQPPFAAAQLSVDPFTGRTLRKEGYAEYTTARKVRSWLRFLHTGEALGWPGQLAAGLASLGATLLVWTGLSLAVRRLLRWRQRARNARPPEDGDSESQVSVAA